MKAVLLAAGLGTRLKPFTNSIPKCLIPVCGTPLLEYWLKMLFDADIDSVLINTHYLADVVVKYIEESDLSNKINVVYEPELLGTGGTLLQNKDWLSDEPFIVAHADNLTVFDVKMFINAHISRPNQTEFTMMTFNTDDPKSCGIVEVDQYGVAQGFFEKVKNPPSNYANAAVYIFEPSIFEILSSINKPIIDLSTEVIPKLLGKIATYHNTGYHRDIGTPESLALANVEFKGIIK